MQQKPAMAEKASDCEDSKNNSCSSEIAQTSAIPQMQIEDPAIIASSEVKSVASPKEDKPACSSNGEVNGLSLTLQNCNDNHEPAGGTTNGHFVRHNYDVAQNGHLSPSDDSGIGDQGSQSSQSPNQSFSTPQMPAGSAHFNPPAVSVSSAPLLVATGYTATVQGHTQVANNATHGHQRAHSATVTPQCRPPSPQNFGSVPLHHQGSRGDSPHRGSPQAPQHVVHVVVNPGETFSVRIGEQIQHIQGPATVRMVSSNGPPVPMPMQVPPGHMVQQIVDENGILTHVILSPQHTALGSPLTTTTPNGTPSPMYPPPYAPPPYAYQTGYNPSQTRPPGPMPHSANHGHIVVTASSSTPSSVQSCNNNSHPHIYQTPAPTGSAHPKDERTQKARERLITKIRQRSIEEQKQGSKRPTATLKPQCKINGDIQKSADEQSSASSLDESESEEDRQLRAVLSRMPLPQVTEIEPKCALISLSPPNLEELDGVSHGVSKSDLRYQLKLMEKLNSNKKDCYNSYSEVYKGQAVAISLTDLQPNTEYHVKAACFFQTIWGDPTEANTFRTSASEPETPQPPRCSFRAKTSLTLKWTPPSDNGSKITAFLLECDSGDNQFAEVYNGPLKQTKVPRLTPATKYLFRLCAINAVGKSKPCESVVYFTSGTVPATPDPPQLLAAYVHSLNLQWAKKASEEDFTLQMEDFASGHGFLPIYTGPDTTQTINNLRRNTEYKLRLQASNEEGPSKWSDTVCYKTLPDRPSPPGKPQLKGKVHPYSFKINWDSPKDTGGADVSCYVVEMDAGMGFEKIYEGTERELLCDHLDPGHSYRVHVSCSGTGGRSEFSECLVVTTLAVQPGVCPQPELQGKPKATSLFLRWAYPDNTGGAPIVLFEVQMINSDNSSREVYKGNELTCVVAGLLPGRHYLFQVRASNKAGVGPWSDILEVVSGAGVPEAPRPPIIQSQSSTCILVTWEEPFHNGATITEYHLELQNHSEGDFSRVYCGSLTEYKVHNLSPASQYGFRVQAVNSAGAGAFSAISVCLTPPGCPGVVLSVRASAMAHTIHMTWKEPEPHGSPVTSYNVELMGCRPPVSVGKVLEYVVEDLLPETAYRLRVQAENAIGPGPFSSAIKMTTKPLPPAPPELEWVASTPNCIKVKWNDSKGLDVLQYCLEMLKENGSFYPIYQGSAHSHKVNRLQEMTTYEFRITARNQVGDGPYSPVYRFSTSRAPPPQVKEPSVSDCGTEQCKISWPACKHNPKDHLQYILQLQTNKQGYREVYRGDATFFHLTGLQPNTDYSVRVCAVRECVDDSGEQLMGNVSPTKIFTTKDENEVIQNHSKSNGMSRTGAGTHDSGEKTATTNNANWRQTAWVRGGQLVTKVRQNANDQQRAFLLLFAFSFIAFVLAYIAKAAISSYTTSVGSVLPPEHLDEDLQIQQQMEVELNE